MLTVKILGSGCPNCKRLEAHTCAALDAAQPPIEYELVEVQDYADIMAYGVMATPALVMNEQVLAVGRIPRAEQIVQWARQFQGA